MTRILIAGDHAIVRRGLEEILRRELPHVESRQAGNDDQVIATVVGGHWDLLVRVLSPGPSGLAVLKTVHAARQTLPILIVSVCREDRYGRRLLQAGASGYLTTSSGADELITAVRRLLSGRRYVSDDLADQLARALQAPDTRPLHESLSNREFDVMWLIAAGKTNAEIADVLSLSDKTVSTYRARILDKLRLRTTRDIIRYALEHHLVT
jgi:two-component system invasion response regulator UvrY